MDINMKYREVQGWLDQLFAGSRVPEYEHNEQTIDILYQLMQRNRACDRDTQLLIQDLQQKAKEYASEGHRLAAVLRRLNLKPASLSQSGIMSLRTLANLAYLLRVRDASDSSFLLALQTLKDEIDRTQEAVIKEKQLLDQLTLKSKMHMLSALHSKNMALYLLRIPMLEQQSVEEKSQMEKRTKAASFLQTKAHEYGTHIAKLKENLKKVEADSSIFHENLVKKAQDLQKLQEQLKPMKQKLQNYHDLPPDISQAKVKVAELRQRVRELEAEMARRIDLMRL
ncbi:HAUS augmin-like complex subunit 1 [Pomacea canaliculata]|uniref:HAUS augmin-like complex subunit 1 n=1 Tax=Pomacea canaliculata TaxID=400727 RepID=UPI000D7352B4|nr:HAUS augmin-like complex subunit 1 [Pomacea canaliculata]